MRWSKGKKLTEKPPKYDVRLVQGTRTSNEAGSQHKTAVKEIDMKDIVTQRQQTKNSDDASHVRMAD